MQLEDYLDQVASKNPAPGGGSIAALAGVFTTALISKLCNLTIGREKYKEHEETLKEILADSESLKKDLMTLVEEDIIAYNLVVEIGKLYRKSNKAQDDDVKELKIKYDEALKYASDIPFKVMELSFKNLKNLKNLIKICNQNALSDAGVALYMALSSIYGAAFNVTVNLKELSDEDYCNKIMNGAEDIDFKTEKLETEIMEYVIDNLVCNH